MRGCTEGPALCVSGQSLAIEKRGREKGRQGTETAAATSNTTALGVSSWPIRSPRAAPTASRVAISRRRVAVRASSRPATLLHAIASSAPVGATGNREGPDGSPHRAGHAARRRQSDRVMLIRSWLGLLVRFHQPYSVRPWPARCPRRFQSPDREVPDGAVRSAVTNPRGHHLRHRHRHPQVGPEHRRSWKPSSATPTTVNSRLLRRIGC
jgi:hypothetical protein